MSVTRLMLGTAAFGLNDYPPGKGHQRVPRDEAVALIRHAYACGVRAFDTAYAYGNGLAEDILEEALDGRPAHVTTKCRADHFERRVTGWLTLQHNPTVDQMDRTADGASVYTSGEAWASYCLGHNHLQLPYWLMDLTHRAWVKEKPLEALVVYARQPYGRGQVPCQAALWFALNSQADYIVFGARSIAQLDDTLRWAESTPPTALLASVCTPRR